MGWGNREWRQQRQALEAWRLRKTLIVRKLLRRNKIRCGTSVSELLQTWQPNAPPAIQSSSPKAPQPMLASHARDPSSDALLSASP